MTVDMLAATFFWPEAMVLGAEQSPPDPSDDEGHSVGATRGLGFRAAIRRLFARMAWTKDPAVQV